MRIISGTKRGMKLLSPKGYETTRPITDRVKESLFSVLYKYSMPANCVVADLFCGTGSMGLESLSRGAKWATFVEKDHKTIDILKRNIAKAAFVAESKVIRASVFKIGAPPAGEYEKYDLVFVDPPYFMTYDISEVSDVGKLIQLVSGQVTDKGIVVLRTSDKALVQNVYGPLEVIDRRRWGTMSIAIMQLGD